MCMKREFMFLIVLIPGPSNPKHNIHVFLQPLIDELCILWTEGILTYDVSLRQNFTMKAALMWTINDFPAYGMLSGWITSGRLTCPIWKEQRHSLLVIVTRSPILIVIVNSFHLIIHLGRIKRHSRRSLLRLPPPPCLSSLDIWNRVAQLPLCTKLQEENIPEYGIKHN